MSLFPIRRNLLETPTQKECFIKKFLGYRDTWQEIPYEGFSVERIVLRARIEKYKQVQQIKLVRSENGFRRKMKDELSSEDVLLRMMQGSLNKLTEMNYDAIIPSILIPEVIENGEVLSGVVSILFKKAVAEPVFSGLYAKVIGDIDRYERSMKEAAMEEALRNQVREKSPASPSSPDSVPGEAASEGKAAEERAKTTSTTDDAAKGTCASSSSSSPPAAPTGTKFDTKSNLRSQLVGKCQKLFQDFVSGNEMMDEEKLEQLRKQSMGNIKFCGELFMRSCVSERLILSVCDIVLCPQEGKVTDANVEMAISLLRVVGERFDERCSKNKKPEEKPWVWERLAKIYAEKEVSQRIRFLIQNLLELRDNNWQARSGTALAPPSTTLSTAAAAAAAAKKNSSGSGVNAMPTPQDASLSSNKSNSEHNSSHNANNSSAFRFSKGAAGSKPGYPSLPTTGKNPHRAQGGEGGDSHKHGHAGSPPYMSSGHSSKNNRDAMDASMGGSPGNSQGSLSPPMSSTASPSEIGAEEKKIISFASPPSAFTHAVELLFVGAIRDALTDGKWEETAKTIKETMFKEHTVPEHTGAMCGAYAVIHRISTCNHAVEREEFARSLRECPCFDISVIPRAFAWFLTYAIGQGLKDDYPCWQDRVIVALLSVQDLTFCTFLRDIIARSGNYLDVLSANDDTYIEQQEELLNFCSSVCKSWKASRQVKEQEEEVKEKEVGGGEVGEEEEDPDGPMAVLDTLKEVKQRQFLREVLPDCLSEMLNEGFLSVDAIRKWLQKVEGQSTGASKKNVESMKMLMSELKGLVEDSTTKVEEG